MCRRKNTLEPSRTCEERIEIIPDWLWEATPEGVITYSNRVVERLLGYSPEDLLGRTIFSLLVAEDVEKCSEALRRAVERREAISHMIGRFVSTRGEVKSLGVSCVPVLREGDRFEGLRGLSRDLTEQMAMQQARREAEENYRTLVESSLTGIFVIQNGRIVFANSTILNMMGYTLEEAYSRSLGDFLHPEDRRRVMGYYRRRLTGREAVSHYEVRVITKSGDVRHLELRATCITFNGAPAILDNVVDVTDRDRAQQALEEAKEKFRSLVEAISDWVWEVDENMVYTYSSPRSLELFGYAPDEVVGKTPFDLMPPDEARRVRDAVEPAVVRREPIHLLLNAMLHRDGHEVIVETSGLPVFDASGAFRGYRGVDRDVTERVHAENALRESEARFRSLYEAVSAGVVVRDRNGAITHANHIAYHILGLSPNDLLGKKLLSIGRRAIREDGSDLPAEEHPAMVALRTREPVHDVLLGIVREDGETTWLLVNADPLLDPNTREIKSVFTTFIDVTGWKVAQEALQEERNFASTVLDTVGALVVVLDSEGRIVRFNRACEQVTGYSFDEVQGKHVWDILLAPDEREPVKRVFEDLRAGQFPKRYENYWVAKNGERRLIEWGNTVLVGRDGTVTHVIGTGIDVTERRRAELALRDSEQRQADIINFLPDATFAIDLQGRVIAWNRAMERMTGVSAAEALGKGNHEHSLPFYGERRPMLADLVLHYDEETASRYDFVRRDDSRLIAETFAGKLGEDGISTWSTASPLYDLEGNIVGAIESIRDVTERRRAERAVKESEERFRLLFEHSPDMVFLLKGHVFTAVNPAVTRVLGYPEGEIVGKSPWDISPEYQPDGRLSRDKAAQVIADAAEKGPTTFDWVHQHKGGSRVDCEVSLVSYSAHGEFYVQAIVRDVTERKLADENRRRLERDLEAQKRQFYRETILSVTDGKLDIEDRGELRSFLSLAEQRIEVDEPAHVAVARHEVERFCRDSRLSGERLETFMIGVGEAITNAIKHGNRGRVYAGKHEGAVWVGVSDRGAGIESLILPRATLLRGFSTKPSLGLGYSIMLDVADRILLSTGERGTIVVLIKNLQEPVFSVSEIELPDTWNNIPT